MTGPPRRRGPRPTLDLDRVVGAALELLDSGGPVALSVRAVAGRLGVAPNALYTYIADRADLERAIVERVLADADLDVLAGPARSWRRRVVAYARVLREALLAHPGAVPLFMTAPMNGPHAIEVGERLLVVLSDAGLGRRDAARAAYLLITYVLGSVALEVAETEMTPPLPPEEERVAARRTAFAAIEPGTHPRSAAAAGTMATWISSRQFEWGLERVLAGLASVAPGDG